MAKRQFRDRQAVTWDVWDVFPGDSQARTPYDRRSESRPASSTPTTDQSPMVDPELAEGWLCFQSGSERRRFAPVPANWHELPDTVLRVMLEIASPVLTANEGSARGTTAEQRR